MKNRTALILTIVSVLAVVPAVAQTDSATQYKRMCVLCHGADGKSDTSMGKSLKSADLTSQAVQSQTDAQLAQVISNGKGKMAAYQSILGKQGVEDMVKYVRSLAPNKK
jgi:cytochrome c6